METKPKSRSIVLPVVLMLCITLVLLGGIGGWVYLRNQQLIQEKELKEKELQIQKESSLDQADAIRDAARSECIGNTEGLNRLAC